MEELRSTEILDREIHEDARKKAEKTLASADKEAAVILSDVDVKKGQIKAEKEAEYATKKVLFQRELDAALPLEAIRFRISLVGKALTDAINTYLSALKPEKRLTLIGNLLENYKSVLNDQKVTAITFGISAAAAKKLLKEKLPNTTIVSCEETSFEKIGETAFPEISTREGIILETENALIRARATLDETVSDILDKNRYELANALFDGRIPE